MNKKPTSKLAYAVLLMLLCIPLSMLYQSWAAERDARAVCADVELGKPFDVAALRREKRPILLGGKDGRAYSYLFIKGYVSTVECVIFVDAVGVALRKEIQTYSD